jgi:hypothetical protein
MTEPEKQPRRHGSYVVDKDSTGARCADCAWTHLVDAEQLTEAEGDTEQDRALAALEEAFQAHQCEDFPTLKGDTP